MSLKEDIEKESLNRIVGWGEAMEIPKSVRSSIKLASMRAKLLFDTYNWTWGNDKVPTISEIEEQYIYLASTACDFKDGTNKQDPSVCATGRLVVEYLEGSWTFSLELAAGYDDEDGVLDMSSPTTPKLANTSELGYVSNN